MSRLFFGGYSSIDERVWGGESPRYSNPAHASVKIPLHQTKGFLNGGIQLNPACTEC